MENDLLADRKYRRQLRVFLEEICAEICRFRHVSEDGARPESIKIRREFAVVSGCYIDILVEPPNLPPYAMEVKFGYPIDVLLDHLAMKFSDDIASTANIHHLVLLVRASDYTNRAELRSAIRAATRANLEVEVWDEEELLHKIKSYFGIKLSSITSDDLLAVRRAIDDTKWRHAFGEGSTDHHLAETLLWHFGFWNLRRLSRDKDMAPNEVLTPGVYSEVAIVMADLCSFSSYVRDTRDLELARHSLTTFYSRARHAIHSAGGMLYQFVGDEVIGLFGIPDKVKGYADQAIDCASALRDIGESVSTTWQKRLDREQAGRGVHIGIAVGELNLLPLLPFSGSRFGFIGDAINMTARLMSEAKPGEIVLSNSFYRLSTYDKKQFEELPTIQAKNVGSIKCWRYNPDE